MPHRPLAASFLLALLLTPEARAVTTPVAPMQICLQPLGRYDKGLLADAKAGIQYLYGFQVHVLAPRRLPESAYYQPRKRYRADKLLDYLDSEIAPKLECPVVIGFTKVDISTTSGTKQDWGILGLAGIGGPSAVVSSYRMRRKVRRRALRQRTVKVVNHELGHALGLPHLPGQGCLMNDARGTVRTVDTETGLLCAEGRRRIQTMHGIELPAHERFNWHAVLK